MGKKKETVEEKKVEEPTPQADAEEEDTPCIKALKAIDDKYCAAEVECEREIEKLRKKYDERQAPLIAERKKVLSDCTDVAADAQAVGTPACPNFWGTALSKCPEFEELLQEHDEDALSYLDDIQQSFTDPDQPQKGIKIEFHFKENPYFTNSVLWVETVFDYDPETYKPYKECDCSEVKSSGVDWKPGKNITVQKTKEDKGMSKKGKKKGGKAKEEPVPSVFRILFNSLKAGDDLPEGLECVYEGDEEDVEDMASFHLENIGELTQFIAHSFLKYAVRYYTGEAVEDEDDDEESEEEEELESSDEESDEPAPKPKKGGKAKGGAAPKKGGSGDATGEKTEECKQQ